MSREVTLNTQLALWKRCSMCTFTGRVSGADTPVPALSQQNKNANLCTKIKDHVIEVMVSIIVLQHRLKKRMRLS